MKNMGAVRIVLAYSVLSNATALARSIYHPVPRTIFGEACFPSSPVTRHKLTINIQLVIDKGTIMPSLNNSILHEARSSYDQRGDVKEFFQDEWEKLTQKNIVGGTVQEDESIMKRPRISISGNCIESPTNSTERRLI